MAEAMVRGFISSGIRSKEHLHVFDPSAARRKIMQEQYGVNCYGGQDDDEEQRGRAARNCVDGKRVVVVAVKPQLVSVALASCRVAMSPETLLVSIAAGTTIDTLQTCCPQVNKRIVRVMPNTPCLIGEAASAICAAENASQEDTTLVRTLMASVGEVVEVPERLMDAVTGLSGSGPAYVYMLIEAMSDGGVAAGLPRDVSLKLAAKTVMGSAKMVLETGKHPGELKDMVTSPAGTTMAGVRSLESSKLRSAMIEAVLSATNRSSELSRL